MKKILNEWRKFLIKEGAPSVPFDDEHLEKKECVYQWSDGDEEHHIVLYRKQKYVDDFYVIGYIAVMQITDPGDDRMQCIPNTFQVSAVYVEPELQGDNFPEGSKPRYGIKMYDLAFAAIPDDAGLTSDKYSGTLPGAERVWNSLSNSPQIEKRKTDTGVVNDKGELIKSTEFDYTGKETPEIPEDDCHTPYKRHQKSNVSHSSLKKVNRSAGISLLMKYKANHESNDFLNKADFERRVLTFAMQRFGQIYSRLANKSLN
jgi:hypothetical protein